MKKNLALIPALLAGLAVSGCSHSQGNMYYQQPSMIGADPAFGQSHMVGQQVQKPMHNNHMQGQHFAQQAAPTQSAAVAQVENDVNVMRERIRRLERAMVRLDRRMQLIERNELSRMTGSVMDGAATPNAGGSFQPMSFGNGAPTLPALQPVPTPSANQQQARFQPVSMERQAQQPRITSTLGVAPQQRALPTQPSAIATGLPSLADSAKQKKEHNVAIWTINYESDKVWPSRKQLPASRDVIESLNSGQPVALFARGVDPSSREFRERVRALSKYLSKVTEVDNLPIASMSAKHLDSDTIELLATH